MGQSHHPEPTAQAPGGGSLLRAWLAPTRLFPLFLAIYLLTHAAFMLWGECLNGEGAVLYSSTLAMKGRVPYRDFAFTLPPAALYVYGAIGAALGPSLLQARAFSALFGLAAFLLMARLMKRRGGPHAVAILSILLALNLGYAFDTSYVQPQSLAVLLYALAIFLAAGGPLTPARSVFSSILIALAAYSWVPCLAILPFFWIFIWLESGRDGRSLFLSLAASTAALLAGFGALANRNMVFDLWRLPDLAGRASLSPPLLTHPLFLPHPLRTLLADQMLCLAILAGVLACLLVSRRRSAGEALREHRLEFLLAGSGLAVTLTAVLAPYHFAVGQSAALPLLAMFAALALGKRLPEIGASVRAGLYAALVSLCVLGTVFQRAPLDANGGKFASARFQEAAEAIRPHVGRGGKLFTFLPIIAYEGGFELPDGLNLGEESHFGACGLTTEECLKFRGVNNRIIYVALAGRTEDVVILTKWQMDQLMERDASALAPEQVADAVKRYYEPLAQFKDLEPFVGSVPAEQARGHNPEEVRRMKETAECGFCWELKK